MSHSSTRLLFCTCTLIALVSPMTRSAGGPPSRETALTRSADLGPRTSADIRDAYVRTPLRFEQHGETADFVARGAGYGVLLSGGDATLSLTGDTYVTGTTTSTDFPTTLDALQRVFGGGQRAPNAERRTSADRRQRAYTERSRLRRNPWL